MLYKSAGAQGHVFYLYWAEGLTTLFEKSTDTAEQVLNLTIRNIRILALKRAFGLIILILQTCKLRPWKGEALSLVPALIQSAFDL